MNKWIFLLVMFFPVLGIKAQQQTAKAVISTPGVCCEICKSRIENYMRREDGVVSVTVDIKKKTTTVVWIKDRSNIEYVKTAIANVGYDADDVTAEESAQRRFPPACKKAAAAAAAARADSTGTKKEQR